MENRLEITREELVVIRGILAKDLMTRLQKDLIDNHDTSRISIYLIKNKLDLLAKLDRFIERRAVLSEAPF